MATALRVRVLLSTAVRTQLSRALAVLSTGFNRAPLQAMTPSARH